MLNIPTAKVGAFEAKRFATNQRNGLGFNFADVPCGLFAVHEPFRCAVPEQTALPSIKWNSKNPHLRLRDYEELARAFTQSAPEKS